MTYENGTFYRIEESPEASPFELSSIIECFVISVYFRYFTIFIDIKCYYAIYSMNIVMFLCEMQHTTVWTVSQALQFEL